MNIIRWRIGRRKLLVRALFVYCFFLVLTLVLVFQKPKNLIRDFVYLTRPMHGFLWDKGSNYAPKIIIPHYEADILSPEKLCSLHGWKLRTNSKPKVIDAIIFSVELDLLEIRLKELWNEVDKFIVMEADRTFTGIKKPMILKQNLDRFAWAENKLVHIALENVLLANPMGPFDNEVKTRVNMGAEIRLLGLTAGDLIIVGDTDEIPYQETIKLLKSCQGFPPELHLQMRNYLYSFEFYVDTNHWRPHVTTFTTNEEFVYYHGRRSSNHQLADAGWHCSFCFRYLSDFVFKMTSYSHSDRVTSSDLIKVENIQKKICDGADIFDMYPEAYTFKALFAAMGNVPRRLSTIGVPKYILEHLERFKFLLPGGCMREEK